MSQSAAFWSMTADELLRQLGVSERGLSEAEARERLLRYGPNLLKPRARADALQLLVNQFKSPIILLLILAAALSFFLGEPTDAVIIMAIVLASGALGFWQERGATDAVAKLAAVIQVKASVLRSGAEMEVPVDAVVPGDVSVLNAGDVIPGDCLILESKDLFVDEAALTGETYPVEKAVADAPLPPLEVLSKRTNALFMGTHVVSGTARALVARTGRETEFGRVSERLKRKPPETEFERGIRRYGYLLLEVTLMLVIAIFAINVFFNRPPLEAFMFALALAVGLTPQLLPAIISIVLSQGARQMARDKVIVKRLESIENFGSMDVLCSDKTGTLTEGVVRVHAALDVAGDPSDAVFRYAYLNAAFESGFTNPIDEAIRSDRPLDVSGCAKLDEIPYDFGRKRLSVLIDTGQAHLMVTKGALQDVLAVCTSALLPDGSGVDIARKREEIDRRFDALSAQGYRILGVAYRDVGGKTTVSKPDEADMTFAGFLVLTDPPKPGIVDTLGELRRLGIGFKIITGDNRLVAAHVSREVGGVQPVILTGPELRHISDEALPRRAAGVDVFAEVEPNQKERIILALKKAGHVVGYMGDGINDASALHAADVSLSVDSAVDVAKEAADIVLLQKDLRVLARGVREGRMTFANTLKYIFITTSANFGNMFSMAGVSLILPYLPMLPKQILLNNFLTDLPAMTIATDTVDPEMVDQPRRWDVKYIRNFMLLFGLISSAFDCLTFGALLLLLHATVDQFRTGWFVESALTEVLILLVIRTRRVFYRSRPSRYLAAAALAVAAVILIVPYSPFNSMLGFVPLPLHFMVVLGIITGLYIAVSEAAKSRFYRRFG